jgi:hypothetical protein
MAKQPPQRWQPTVFRRFVRSIPTSTGPAEIITDAGPAFIKALGNKEGPHALACEWVGTKLASALGLRTFDIAIMRVNPDDEIPLGHDCLAQPGPAIVVRKERGHGWSGYSSDLDLVENREDAVGLIVLDTWTRNPDRYPPALAGRRQNLDNIFLTEEGASPGRFLLKAIDHTCCFAWGRSLSGALREIDCIKDDRLYGCFPGLRPLVTRDRLLTWAERLQRIEHSAVEEAVDAIPSEWDVAIKARSALVELLCSRARYVADTIVQRMKEEFARYGELLL